MVYAEWHEYPQAQIANLNLTNGSIITHTETTTAEVYKVNITVTGDMIVDSTSTVDTKGRGFLGGYSGGNNSYYGRTSGNTTTNGSYYDCGGSYGGLGGKGDSGNIGSTYGDLTNPIEPGAGGGGEGTSGGDGGGLVRLTVNGTLTNNGTISATGNNGNNSNNGGGAGGGIYISCGTLGGSGTISANGGNATGGYTGGGGGGRIAILYTTKSYTGAVTAYGGSGYNSGGNGGAGTIYWMSTSQTYGDLVVDNNNTTTSESTGTPLSGTTTSFNNITISNKGRLTNTTLIQVSDIMSLNNSWYMPSGTNTVQLQAGTLNLSNGATITHPETATSEVYRIDIKVTVNMNIEGTSTVNVNGRGYLGGYSGGNNSYYGRTSGNTTTNGSYYDCGGSYGGLGGKGDSGNIGSTYGDLTNPIEPGAGGGSEGTSGGDGEGLFD